MMTDFNRINSLQSVASESSSLEPLLGPLNEMLQGAGNVAWDIIGQNIPRDLHWQYLAMTFVIATFLWCFRSGRGSRGADGYERKADFLTYLLPKDIYTHVSARVDIWLWITERLLRPIWIVLLMATVGPGTESAVIAILKWAVGDSPAMTPNYSWMLLYSLTTLLLYDFIFFTIHYTMHRVPA